MIVLVAAWLAVNVWVVWRLDRVARGKDGTGR